MGFCHDDNEHKSLEKDEHAGLRLLTGAELFVLAGVILAVVHVVGRFL